MLNGLEKHFRIKLYIVGNATKYIKLQLFNVVIR
jgi:hypothetical protein